MKLTELGKDLIGVILSIGATLGAWKLTVLYATMTAI